MTQTRTLVALVGTTAVTINLRAIITRPATRVGEAITSRPIRIAVHKLRQAATPITSGPAIILLTGIATIRAVVKTTILKYGAAMAITTNRPTIHHGEAMTSLLARTI